MSCKVALRQRGSRLSAVLLHRRVDVLHIKQDELRRIARKDVEERPLALASVEQWSSSTMSKSLLNVLELTASLLRDVLKLEDMHERCKDEGWWKNRHNVNASASSQVAMARPF